MDRSRLIKGAAMGKKIKLFPLIALVVIVVAVICLPNLLELLRDSLAAPWAHSLHGEPTLTGRWIGELRYENIGSRAFVLEIRHDPVTGRSGNRYYARRGAFNGTAEMSDEQGYRIQYEIWGASNRDGSEIHINLRDLNRKVSAQQQPQVVDFNAVWRGKTLELTGRYEMIVYDGTSSTSNSDWPAGAVTGLLKKP